MLTLAFVSCGKESTQINVYSREKGSGTRGAFIELFGIEEKNADGEKVDLTSDSANITDTTAVMLQQIKGDKNGIGYVSLGSLSDDVKALKIDGASASVANVENGSYKVSRPFNIVTKSDSALSLAAQDFYNYILSTEGQLIVSAEGYIALKNTASYSSNNASGTVTVSGSSSVTPLMEAIVDAYKNANPNVTVQVQLSDSGTGIKDAISGTSDIGMASRALKDSEASQGVKATVIATDGIAVIVNKDCAVDSLTSEQVKQIFKGEITDWSEITAE